MIVPFDPAIHERFVFSGFCRGAGEPRDWLHYLLRHGARCAVRVAPGNRDLYYAFAVATGPQTIAWAYTKEKLRNQGFLRELLGYLGVDVERPMVAMLSSPACEALKRKGWPIRYLVEDLYKVANGG
jgi:hypothetical protein